MKLQILGRIPPETPPWLYQQLQDIAEQVNGLSSGTVASTINAYTAAPTTGTYAQGDFVKNSAPSGATPTYGWICTVGGTPGTWVALNVGAGGGANLTWTASTRTVASDTGTDAVITLVTSTDAGLAPASGGGTTNFLRADATWAAPTAVVADGDKGDITVSGSGATWSIDNDVVTFAKFQNITDARLLGRSAGSAGDMQELTVGVGLSLASGSLVGSLLETRTSDPGAPVTGQMWLRTDL
jgi:hypothetical protein